MAYQLVYTSSPRGLKPGAFGFCVVACTRGMREQTSSALEALSGYRRVFADPRDALRNPTACSHVLFDTPTGRLRILSRVADAGLDYSGRTNKIACFLDVAPNELTPPGPAALFSAPGLFVTNWPATNAPQYYEAPTAIPNFVPIPAGCDEWRKTTGDAGWAGALASTVASRRPAILVVRPDQNVLRLFQESLALLPPGERWNATFSTYYMKAPPGVQCQWKAVMQGSPEESALRATPGVLMLDLTAPSRLPCLATFAATPEVQTLVAAARGVNPSVAVPTQLPNDRVFRPVPNAATAPSPFGAAPTPSATLPGAMPIGANDTYDLSSPVPTGTPVPPGATRRRKTLNYGRDAILTVDAPPQRSATLLTKILACVGAAAILLGVVLAFLISGGFLDNFFNYKNALDEAVAEANGQPDAQGQSQDSTPTSEETKPESDAPSTTESGEAAEKDGASKEDETVEQDGSSENTADHGAARANDSQNAHTSANAGATGGAASKSETPPSSNTQNGAFSDSQDAGKKNSASSDSSQSESSDVGKNAGNASKTSEDGDKTEGKTSSRAPQSPKDETEDSQGAEAQSGSSARSSVSVHDDGSEDGEEVDNLVAEAKKITDALDNFKKNGSASEFNKARDLVIKYHDRNDIPTLKEARELFYSVEDAKQLDSYRFLIQGKEMILPLIQWKEEYLQEPDFGLCKTEDEGEFYSDVDDFFRVFDSGVIRLTFKFYEDNNTHPITRECRISADDFRNARNKPNLTSRFISGYFNGGSLKIDLERQFSELQFDNPEQAWKWLLCGSIEVEAFAKKSMENSSRVFHAPAEPFLNCSDNEVELGKYDEFNPSLAFGMASPDFKFSEDKMNSLVIEYVQDEGSKFFLASPNELAAKNYKDKSNDKQRVVVLKYKGKGEGNLPAPVFFYEITFSLVENSIKKKSDRRLNIGKDDGNLTSSGENKLPEDLKESELKFNVRYVAYVGQDVNSSPIIGVIKIPLSKSKKQRRSDSAHSKPLITPPHTPNPTI